MKASALDPSPWEIKTHNKGENGLVGKGVEVVFPDVFALCFGHVLAWEQMDQEKLGCVNLNTIVKESHID